MRIEVTMEDIAHGVRADSARCPVARAVQRITGEHSWEFDIHRVYQTFASYVYYEVPRFVKQAAEGFDLSGQMMPLAFDVAIPMGEQKR